MPHSESESAYFRTSSRAGDLVLNPAAMLEEICTQGVQSVRGQRIDALLPFRSQFDSECPTQVAYCLPTLFAYCLLALFAYCLLALLAC